MFLSFFLIFPGKSKSHEMATSRFIEFDIQIYTPYSEKTIINTDFELLKENDFNEFHSMLQNSPEVECSPVYNSKNIRGYLAMNAKFIFIDINGIGKDERNICRKINKKILVEKFKHIYTTKELGKY